VLNLAIYTKFDITGASARFLYFEIERYTSTLVQENEIRMKSLFLQGNLTRLKYRLASISCSFYKHLKKYNF